MPPKFNISNLLGLAPEDIQKFLDERVNARFAQFGRVVYVPQDKTIQEVCPTATHALTLSSFTTDEVIQVAIDGEDPYTMLANMALGIF